MSQGELLARTVRGLDEAGIPHMRFVEGLPRPELYADVESAREAPDRRTSFNIIEPDTGWKVDLLIRRDRQFSRDEMDRRIPVRLLEADTHVAMAEDTIIAKLEWAKEGASERQLRDVASILAVNRGTLDRVYLGRWITSLGLTEPWERAQGFASDR